MTLSPSVIFHSHSRLDNVFSGCGRTIEQTIRDCLTGRTTPDHIPQICVLQLPPVESDPGAPRFVSLNNRRLYVYKELLRLDKLKSGVITVRLRMATKKEAEKYRKQTLVPQARIKKVSARVEVGTGGKTQVAQVGAQESASGEHD